MWDSLSAANHKFKPPECAGVIISQDLGIQNSNGKMLE